MPAGWQRRQLFAVCRILERGDSDDAATALAHLPESWIPLLSAATTSPDHGQVLHDFLNESRRADALRQQWWLTLAYPVVLLCLATTVMTILAIFIIPEFRAIFDDFDLQLPHITLAILNTGWFLSRWGIWIILALVLVLAIVLLKANRLLPTWAFGWLTERIRLPFNRRTSIARFVRFAADLIESGVGLPNAVRIAGFAVNRSRMQQAAWRLANELESTGGFSQRAIGARSRHPSLTPWLPTYRPSPASDCSARLAIRTPIAQASICRGPAALWNRSPFSPLVWSLA